MQNQTKTKHMHDDRDLFDLQRKYLPVRDCWRSAMIINTLNHLRLHGAVSMCDVMSRLLNHLRLNGAVSMCDFLSRLLNFLRLNGAVQLVSAKPAK